MQNHNLQLLLTNPPIRAGKKVVHEIFEGSYRSFIEGGELVGCYSKKARCTSAMDKMEQLFGNVEVVEKKKAIIS